MGGPLLPRVRAKGQGRLVGGRGWVGAADPGRDVRGGQGGRTRVPADRVRTRAGRQAGRPRRDRLRCGLPLAALRISVRPDAAPGRRAHAAAHGAASRRRGAEPRGGRSDARGPGAAATQGGILAQGRAKGIIGSALRRHRMSIRPVHEPRIAAGSATAKSARGIVRGPHGGAE